MSPKYEAGVICIQQYVTVQACGMSFTYKRKMTKPRIEPCGTPYNNSPGDEKSFPMFTKKAWFVRYDRNENMTYEIDYFQIPVRFCRLHKINMCQVSGKDKSRIGSDREFCFYRGILVSARGQFFQLL